MKQQQWGLTVVTHNDLLCTAMTNKPQRAYKGVMYNTTVEANMYQDVKSVARCQKLLPVFI